MYTKINNVLSKCSTIAVIGHINPDGDCFGSMCGMHDYIASNYNCLIHCFADTNRIAEELKPFVKGITLNPTPQSRYDCCICVDSADLGRLGKYIDVFNSSNYTICIDHHATNLGYANINLIECASSNCENVFNLLMANNYIPSKSTAGKLFAGMITDTNNLTNSNVTSSTYEMASKLISYGINSHKIVKHFFGGNTFVQFKLLGLAIAGAKFHHNNTIMEMHITQQQMDEVGATQEDLNPIINQAFCMKHAKSAFLVTPRNNEIHVSFRAREGLDVSSLAQHFGGGGHKLAAAFTNATFTNKDIDWIINNLKNQINNLKIDNENLF